jgi:hypothetical protein
MRFVVHLISVYADFIATLCTLCDYYVNFISESVTHERRIERNELRQSKREKPGRYQGFRLKNMLNNKFA